VFPFFFATFFVQTPRTPVNFFAAEAGRLKEVKESVAGRLRYLITERVLREQAKRIIDKLFGAELLREQESSKPQQRDILEQEKPNILRRLVSSSIKHVEPEVREEKMKASVKASSLEKLTPPKEPKNAIKILVVEDNRAIQLVMQSLLYKLNYDNVMVASNGLEGVEKFKEYKPDIIFMVSVPPPN
tara:strand:+ start:157 stop:717 length:561 start_codon:yes stop_codon:yes gene_type:complete